MKAINLVNKKYRILVKEDEILMQHNIPAYYDVASSFLNGDDRVAVVRATGTGKAYITIKLLWQNFKGGYARCSGKLPLKIEKVDNAKYLYLAPTNAILEQIKKDIVKTGKKELLEHIEFSTYSSLLLKFKNMQRQIQEDELKEIKLTKTEEKEFVKYINSFSFVVLDEFHRVDENKWGQAVKTAIEQSEKTKFFGTSATPVRTSGVDTAESIFQNNVVSTLSLATAIQQGILPVPEYYTAIYSYEKIIQQYERKISTIKEKSKRIELTNKVNEIKKQILSSVNSEEILLQHLSTHKNGRFIIFNDDISSSTENVEKIKKLLQHKLKISQIYEANSQNPKALEQIDEFEKNNKKGLKLLFVVDMLNEGVHIKDVDGVIMLRKTNSYIVYQQQLGRALSCEKSNKNPLVLDFVNNLTSTYEYEKALGHIQGFWSSLLEDSKDVRIQNLIACIKREMKIVESLKNLDSLLSNSFEDRIYPLRVWQERNENKPISEIKQYDTIEVDGKVYKIGSLISVLRLQYKLITNNGIKTKHKPLTQQEVQILEEMGMVWVANNFDERIYPLKVWQERNNYQPISNINYRDEITIDGKVYKIGYLIGTLIQAYKKTKGQDIKQNLSDLTPEQIKILEEMGMVWVKEKTFEQIIEPLLLWHQQTGNPLSKIVAGQKFTLNDKTYNIGNLISSLKQKYKNSQREVPVKGLGILTQQQIQLLESYGMTWEYSFEERIKPLLLWQKEFKKPISMIKTQQTYESDGENYNIGSLIVTLRTQYNNSQSETPVKGIGELTKEQIKMLEQMGMVWNPNSFENIIKPLVIWCKKTGKSLSEVKTGSGKPEKLEIDGEMVNIGNLVKRLRTAYLKTTKQDYNVKSTSRTLTEEEIKLLEDMGIVWEAKKTFDKRIEPLVIWHNQTQNPLSEIMSADKFVIQDKEINMGNLINSLRYDYRKKKLSKEHIEVLEQIGMIWNPSSLQERIKPLKMWQEQTNKPLSDIKNRDVFVFEGKEYAIGSLIASLRKAYRITKANIKTNQVKQLTDEEIKMLEDMGIVWETQKSSTESLGQLN